MNETVEKGYYPRHDRGFEVAISSDDLALKGYCRILEKQSTSGFEEVPQIEYPDRYAQSNKIIQYDQYWCLEFNWVVYGPLACLLDCGYWKSIVYFEWMGGKETHFSPHAITQDLGKPGHKYTSLVNIKPGDLKPGVYRIVCCLQWCFKDGSPGPIVGFDDKGLVKIYKDKKSPYYPYPYNAETNLPVSEEDVE